MCLLAMSYIVSFIFSVIGFIIISILALSFYDSCNGFANTDVLCSTASASVLFWSMFGLGIAIAFLSGVYFTVLMGYINIASNSLATQTKIREPNNNNINNTAKRSGQRSQHHVPTRAFPVYGHEINSNFKSIY